MDGVAERLRKNLRLVSQRIGAACQRCGRDPASVQVVAVTKYAEWSWVEEIVAQGIRVLGESRPQQLVERSERMQQPVEWHLIGHLQRNKVRRVLPAAALIHSVDSWHLMSRIDEIAGELDLRPRVLLQINISGEESKGGLSADELRRGLTEAASLAHVKVMGLMTMAPYSDDPEAARPVFRELRELREGLAAVCPADISLVHLSMGMSNDFEVAIEEGATLVRLGSVLFSELTGTDDD